MSTYLRLVSLIRRLTFNLLVLYVTEADQINALYGISLDRLCTLFRLSWVNQAQGTRREINDETCP